MRTPWLSARMPARPRSRTRGATPAAPAPGIVGVLAGRTLHRGRLEPIEIGLDADGFIARVGRDLRGPRRHDVGERILLPAATDLHVHFRDPVDRGRGESWTSGTIAAALGGVGLAGEMPNAVPPVDRVDRLVERRAAGEGRIAVDLLLYGALTDPRRVPALAREAGAFKLYLAPTTGIEQAPSIADLPALLEAAAATGLPLTVHAEDPREFGDPAGAADPVAWDAARPARAEESAVHALLGTAPLGLRLNVAHVSSPGSIEALRGAGCAFEASPHHLLLSARTDRGPDWKANPPLRDETVRAELFRRFAAGEIPFLASDHAPHPAAERDRPFPLAPSGLAGVSSMLPVFLAEARAGRVPLAEVIRAACERPARWLGVPMGRLQPGYRADLIVVDPKLRRPIRGEAHGPHATPGPFEAREAIFPVEHYHDGERIVAEGEFVGDLHGRFVRPEYAPLGRSAFGGGSASPEAD